MDNTFSILLCMLVWNRGCISISSTASPFFVSDNTCTWSSCKSHCENSNGRLVVLDTPSKYDLVEHYHANILSSIELFIGLYTTTRDCTHYTWINGDLLSWSKWDLAIDEPNVCDTDFCVRVYRGLFRTTHCSTGHKALCENVVTESSTSMPSATTSITTATEPSSSRATMGLTETSIIQLSTSTTKQKIESSKTTFKSPSTSMSMTTFMTLIKTSAAKESSSQFPIQKTTFTESNTQNAANSAAVITATDMSLTETEATNTAHIQTSSDPPKTYDSCREIQVNVIQLTQAELQETVDLLKAQLTVQKKSTSIALRKRISVYDSRPSCLAMGGVAAAIFSVLIGWIIIPDVISLFTYLYSNVNKSNTINP